MRHNKILVVEDEPEIANLIKRSLRLKKYQIVHAESGTRALDILNSERPDLILLDVMMPDMDGFEVCRQVKQKPECQKIPVVFLTVRNNPNDKMLGKMAGGELYLTKPFDPFILGEEVEKILKKTTTETD